MQDFHNGVGNAPVSPTDNAPFSLEGWGGMTHSGAADKAARKNRARKAMDRACGRVIEGLLPLEPRLMLAAGSKATNVVARFDGNIPVTGASQQVSIHINPADFTPTRTGDLILGFQMTAADGSPLDPSSVVIDFAPLNTLSNHPVLVGLGSVGNSSTATAKPSAPPSLRMTPLYVQPDLAGGRQSVAVFNLPYSNYTITLGGDRGTTGGWHLDVYLVGDLNGDHAVDRATDSSLIRQAYGARAGQGGYKVEGDANLDGIIDSTDVALETRNIGAGTTSIAPLTLTAALNPNPPRQLLDGTPLTNQSSSGITGITVPGVKVQLDLHGGTTFADGTTTAAADGSYSFPITLVEGLNTFNVRATDRFGQSLQATLKVSLDDIAPQVSPPDLRSSSDSGSSNSDNYTNVSKPTLDVQAETGALVTLLADGQSVGSTVAINGTASFTLGSVLQDGVHHFRATATDAAGNLGTSATLDVTIDTQPPLVTLILDPTSDTAPLGDNRTTLSAVTIDGLTEPTTPVTLAQGNLSVISGADGKFSFNNVALIPGSNVFSASATDLAGNVGSGGVTVILDAPLGLTAALSPSPTKSLKDGTPLTNNKSSGVTGKTSPGATVVLDARGGGFVDGTTVAALDGTYTIPVTLLEGLNTLKVKATDGFGQTQQASLKVSLDDIAPPISPPDLQDASDSGSSKTDNYTNVTKPTFDVLAETDSLVTLLIDGQSVGSTPAINGLASFTLTAALLDGVHHVTASATDAAGNVGTSTLLDVTIDTQPPLVSLTLDPASDTAPLGDNHTTLATVILNGLTEPTTPVTLAQGNLSLVSGSDGKFSFNNVPLVIGDNAFSVTATDLAGNVGTGGLTITRDVTAVNINLLEGTHYHVVYQQTITVPAGPSFLAFTYDNLNFDTAARFVKDAFEATLIGTDGKPDTFTIGTAHDAYYNLTEGQSASLAKGVNVRPGLTAGSTIVSVDLSSIPAGSQSKLELRLVNDDSDTTTAVHISDVHVQADALPTGGTTGPVGLLAAFISPTGKPANPSQPGINVVTTTAQPSGPVTATSSRPAGPSAPSTTMSLTAAGAAAGFTLSTYATGFPVLGGIVGPLAIGFVTGGAIMASDYNGDIRIFPNDADGQNAAAIPVVANYGIGNAIGIAQVGQKFYMTQQTANAVIQLNPDGTFNQTIMAGVPFATGIVAAPNGHLFVSASGAIFDIDPIAKTKTVFNNAGADGLIISPDGTTLYAAVPAPGEIQGFNLVSKALVFNSGAIPGTIDGLALGVGALSGRIFVNTNSGTVIQVNLATSVQTLLATGGSRGDFVTVDPIDGSLLLSQTDRFIRLTAPAGGGFNTLVDVKVTATTPQSHVSADSTVLISGRATTSGTSLTNPTSHGPFVPSTVMNLTAAATSAGFKLSTFATGFVEPLGWALMPDGTVMASDVLGNVRIFPNNDDGQTTAGATLAQNYGSSNGDAIAQVGRHVYIALQSAGSVIEVNPDGTFVQTIVTGIPGGTGMVSGANGLLYVSNLGNAISEVDPIAKTKKVFLNVGADGVGFSADGTIFYAESGSHILGFDFVTKAQVFDSGPINGGADGMAVGVGALTGSIFVNTNGGTLIQVNIATKVQTVLGTGGSRGDLVAIDPSDGSLLLTQSDRILRLIGPVGSGFGNIFPSTIKSVTVNGVPVDALDGDGNFFIHVPVQPGPNGYVVLATDSGDQTAFVKLSITGDTVGSSTTTNVVDLSGNLTPKFGRTSLNEKTGVLYTQVAALNSGTFGVNKPLFVGITHLSNPSVTVLNPDGYTDTGIPYFDYSSLVTGNHLEPGQQTGFREISFANSGKTQFTFDLVPLGTLNTAPLITSQPTVQVLVGKPYQYAVTAIDPDSDPLTYSLTSAPDGMSIDPNTGLISFASSAAGLYDVSISVSDGRGGIAQQQYQLNVIVAPSNRPPIFVTAPVVDATAGKPYTYTSQAVDPDADPVKYSLIPTDYNLSPKSVPIVNPGFEADVLNDAGFREEAAGWTKLAGSGGAYNPTINSFPSVPEGQNVLFSNGSTYSQVLTTAVVAGNRYTLQVQVGWPLGLPFGGYAIQLWADGAMLGQATGPVPSAPGTFTTATVDVAINAGNAAIGKALEIRLVGNGVQEEFDDVRLTVTPPATPVIPIPDGLTIDAATGLVAWSPMLSQVGANTLSIQATDGKGGATTQTYVVNVASGQIQVVTNHPPIITSTPPVGPAVVGLPYKYAVTAMDPDNDPLSFSIPAPPLGMTIDATTGILLWTPPVSLIGTSHVLVVVNDGRGGTTSQPFDLTVAATGVNDAPSITSTPIKKAEADRPYVYAVTATDPNADPLVFSLTAAPNGMVIDATSGVIRWLPTAADLGLVRNVTVSVSDGRGGIATQSYGISVASQIPNHAPVITSDPPRAAAIGQLYRYNATATDSDNDLLIWNLDKSPSGMIVDPITGVVVWKPQANQLGTQSVILHVSDGHGGEVTQSFDVNVLSVNRPPGITSAPPTFAIATKPYSYAVTATDPDGDPLTYSLVNGSVGMVVNPVSGLLTWTPTSGEIGSNTVIIRATDSHGAFGQQTYSVIVSASPNNRPPTITSTPPFVAEPTKTYTYAIIAVDPDRDVLHYALLTAPPGMTIDTKTGLVTWTPTAAQVGTFTVSLAAIDTSDAQMTQSFHVVSKVNHPPTITSQPNLTATATGTYQYTLTATDPDNDPLAIHLDIVPSGMTVDVLGNITWSPLIADIGAHPVQLTVFDPHGASATQSFTVTVSADNVAPKIQILVDRSPVNINEVVNIHVQAADGVGVSKRTLLVDGQPVVLDINGGVALKLTHAGDIALVATATDAFGNVATASGDVLVVDPTDIAAPIVHITSPTGGSRITSLANVIGTVADSNLLFYTLSFAPADGSAAFKEIFRGTTNVTNAKLGTFDPTLLANDTYILRLDAVNAGGHEAEDEVTVDVFNNLKLGNFTLSFTDLTIPLGGLPITIGRTYDTLNANRNSDFGFGWRLDVGGTQLRSSLPPDPLAEIGVYSAFIPGTRVYVTLPGGKREGFTFNPGQAPGLKGRFLDILQPSFEADPGVTDTLTVDPFDIFFDTKTGKFTDYYGSLPYNPADSNFGSGQYTLTTKTGAAFRIDGNSGGLVSLSDPLGTTLTFTDNGITSSRGSGVTFTRDPKGRITAITDPAGKTVKYTYDADGNLVSSTDRDSNVTSYQYDPAHPHYLQKVIDPLGRTGVKSTYDAQGRLTQIVGANGAPILLKYDSGNRVQTTTDPLGNKSTVVFDINGNPVQVLDAAGHLTTRTFDAAGNTLTDTDPLGNTTTRTYDNRSNMLTMTDPLGHKTTFTYDNFGKPLTEIDPLGNVTVRTFNRGEITSETTPTGDVFTATYDAAGNRTSTKDGNGNTTTYTYAGTGFVTSIFQADGSGSLISADPDGNVTSDHQFIVGASGTTESTWSYAYDNAGNMTNQTNAQGNSLRLKYDAVGNLSGNTDALGKPWTFNYTDGGQVAGQVAPDGSTTTVAYDADGRASAATMPDGSVVHFEYDAVGNRTKTLFADGSFTTRTYDAAGRVESETGLKGTTSNYTYDAAGELLTATGPGNTVTSYTYDADGHRTSVTDPLGGVTRYEYDAAGRVTKTTYPDGTFTTSGYDHNGHANQFRDLSGAVWHYAYGVTNLLNSVTAPDGLITSYVYNSDGKVEQITDTAGHAVNFAYDSAGRRTSRVLAGGGVETYKYNADGTLAEKTDAAGIITTYTFNDQSKITGRTVSNGETEAFNYDLLGNLTHVTDSRGGTVLAYDGFGHVTRWQGPTGTIVRYAYDSHGRLTGVTTTAGTTATTYDEKSGIATLTGIDGGISTATHDALGRITTVLLPGGATETKTYDADNRTTQIADTGTGGQEVFSLAYTRDSAGRISKTVDGNGRIVVYTYDVNSRVTGEKITTPGVGVRTISYSYDGAGNLTSRIDSAAGTSNIAHNSDDQFTSDGAAAFTWNADGNLATRTEAGVTETFTYDARNRLIKVVRTGVNAGPAVIQYEYEYDGLMAARIVDGVRTMFTWDRTSAAWPLLLEEHNAAGNLTHRYEYLAGVLHRSIDGAGVFQHYATDSEGTVRAITSSDGTVLHSYAYDAYGRPLDTTTADLAGPGYIGGWTDPITGFVYLQNRWYSPKVAAFIQRDPADPEPNDTRTLNRYVYGAGDPVNKLDPTGKISFSVAELAVVTAILGIGYELSLPGSTVQDVFFGFTNLYKSFKHMEYSATVIPAISANIPAFAGDTVGATLGLELLEFHNHVPKPNAVYFEFGVSFGTPQLAGLSIGTFSPGSVFDTPTPKDYNGWFFSVSLSGGLSKLLNTKSGLVTPVSVGGSVFWSPTLTYTDSDGASRYSHGYGGGAGISFGEDGIVNNTFKVDFRLSLTYYILIDAF